MTFHDGRALAPPLLDKLLAFSGFGWTSTRLSQAIACRTLADGPVNEALSQGRLPNWIFQACPP